MFSPPVPAKWLLAALAVSLGAQYWITDFRPSRILAPANPIRTDIEGEIDFLNPAARDGPPVIVEIERSTGSDFAGMLVDLESASISSVPYGVSQQNTAIRFSTGVPPRSRNAACRTLFEVSLPEQSVTDNVSIRGKTTDDSDRTGKSGMFEFDLRSSTALKLTLALEPGETGAPEDCKGEFWVGETRYPVGALNPLTFQVTAGKRATFRFSKPPAAGSQIRLTSGFDASEVIVRGPDGGVRSRYSAPSHGQPISVKGLVFNPGAMECSLLGDALWSGSGSWNLLEWAGQNRARLALYGVVDLLLLILLIARARIERITVWPEPQPAGALPEGPYVFLSYARPDLQLAGHLANRLRTAGVNARFDQELRPGDKWIQRLRTLIGGCFALIVLMTPESSESDFVLKEIRFAQETGRPVIPVLIRDTNNLLLMDLHHIDARANRDVVPDLLASLSSLGYRQTAHGAGTGG